MLAKKSKCGRQQLQNLALALGLQFSPAECVHPVQNLDNRDPRSLNLYDRSLTFSVELLFYYPPIIF